MSRVDFDFWKWLDLAPVCASTYVSHINKIQLYTYSKYLSSVGRQNLVSQKI